MKQNQNSNFDKQIIYILLHVFGGFQVVRTGLGFSLPFPHQKAQVAPPSPEWCNATRADLQLHPCQKCMIYVTSFNQQNLTDWSETTCCNLCEFFVFVSASLPSKNLEFNVTQLWLKVNTITVRWRDATP